MEGVQKGSGRLCGCARIGKGNEFRVRQSIGHASRNGCSPREQMGKLHLVCWMGRPISIAIVLYGSLRGNERRFPEICECRRIRTTGILEGNICPGWETVELAGSDGTIP